MTAFIRVTFHGLAGALLISIGSQAAMRQENFDREPSSWEGVNNRSTAFEPKTVTQNFGYSPGTARAGGSAGEVGGRINPAGEPAFYGYRLPQAATLETPLSAEGRLLVAPGSSHALFGFFNTNTLNEWRTPNTIVLRLNGRGDGGFHVHLEYATAKWRAGGNFYVAGKSARLFPPGQYSWSLAYDPSGGNGQGRITVTLDGKSTSMDLRAGDELAGGQFDRFGLVTPWIDGNGQDAYFDDLSYTWRQ